MLDKIKLRMLLTNLAILFGVILIIIMVVYVSMRMNIYVNTDGELASQAVQMKRFLQIFDSEPADPGLIDEFGSFMSLLKNTSTSCCVWNGDYTLIAGEAEGSVGLESLKSVARLIFCEDTKASKLVTEYKDPYYIYNIGSYRVLCAAMANEVGELRTVQLISNMDAKNDFSKRLLQTLIITGALGALLSFIIGHFMTSRAIIPIEDSINRQKEFVAHASHELRTPITIVRTNLDVVLSSRDETVESQAQWIENAYKETERMEKLVEDLLKLAKSDFGQSGMSFKTVMMQEVAETSVNRMENIAGEKEIQIELMHKDQDMPILGDKSRLEELMAIVLENAVLYSPKGSSIYVSCEKSKNNVIMKIKDQGIGLEPGENERIFERFYRADKARSRREGGAGLGLSIAKWIVESHKGNIYAEGAKGDGTTITIELPSLASQSA